MNIDPSYAVSTATSKALGAIEDIRTATALLTRAQVRLIKAGLERTADQIHGSVGILLIIADMAEAHIDDIDDETGPNNLPHVAAGQARWTVETPLGDASFPTYEEAESFVNRHGGTGFFHAMPLQVGLVTVHGQECSCPLCEYQHVDYPHHAGYLFDCVACEARCHCAPGNAECVFEGDHNGTGVSA